MATAVGIELRDLTTEPPRAADDNDVASPHFPVSFRAEA
jgi:hypothetical protein